MIPLVDMHCHLLAGLDDGPRTEEDALEMCRIAYAEGVRVISALAHQNEHWDAVTPERIRESADRLARLLKEAGIGLALFPSAEVMAQVEMDVALQKGELLTVADRGQYLLLEMPDGRFVDLRNTVQRLRGEGVRPILAHPERHPELLHDVGLIDELIELGCLVQVSSGSVTSPASRQDRQALRSWFRRGVVHFMGSDGHSPRRRRPAMAEAYRVVTRWAGESVANRVFSTNGIAAVHGLPLRTGRPQAEARGWISKIWENFAVVGR